MKVYNTVFEPPYPITNFGLFWNLNREFAPIWFALLFSILLTFSLFVFISSSLSSQKKFTHSDSRNRLNEDIVEAEMQIKFNRAKQDKKLRKKRKLADYSTVYN
jgi:hypothetical protein